MWILACNCCTIISSLLSESIHLLHRTHSVMSGVETSGIKSGVNASKIGITDSRKDHMELQVERPAVLCMRVLLLARVSTNASGYVSFFSKIINPLSQERPDVNSRVETLQRMQIFPALGGTNKYLTLGNFQEIGLSPNCLIFCFFFVAH